jgi:hypothetical protein
MLESMKKGGGKKKAKEVIAYERKSSMPSKIAKGPSKEQREEGAATIKRVGREMRDKFEGTQEFGDDYEKLDLTLSGVGINKSDIENPKKMRYFTSKNYGDEEVTRYPNTEALKVTRKNEITGKPEAFVESIKERKERVYQRDKARVLDMLKKAKNQKPLEPTRYMSDENVSRLAEGLKKNKNK